MAPVERAGRLREVSRETSDPRIGVGGSDLQELAAELGDEGPSGVDRLPSPPRFWGILGMDGATLPSCQVPHAHCPVI